MEGRKIENYINILQKTTLLFDFEKAERKALMTVFPHAKVYWLLFFITAR